jgi:cell division protein FtsB
MKNKRRRKKFNNIVVLFIVLLGCYVIYKFISLEINYQKLVSERDELVSELNDKKLYYDQLNATVEQAQSDDYIEQLAKKYLGLINKDEKIFIVQQSNNEDSADE